MLVVCLQLVPAAAATSLVPSWSLSGQPDLEEFLASSGVTGSLLLAAMAAAHNRMAAACAAAHRRAPGVREAKTWAVTAGVLLQQGRCLGPALWNAWVQAYMRGYAATAGLVADGQGIFLALCQQLQIQPPLEATQHDVVLPLQQQAAQPDNNAGGDVDMLCEQQQQQHSALMAVAASGHIWPSRLLRPCQWPVWVSYADITQQSSTAAAVRDVSLPVWLLAQALAADLQLRCSNRQSAAAVGQVMRQLSAAQQALLPLHLLVEQQAAAATTPADSLDSDVCSSVASCLKRLPELVLAAAAACLCRPAAAGSSNIRQLVLQQQIVQMAAAATAVNSSITTTRMCVQLADLCQQLLPSVAAQPWQQLVLCDPQLSNQQHNLPLLLPILQQAACHAAVAAAAAAAAPAAVAAGAPTPYQESVWRLNHPSERARSEASHPVVDGLQPALAAVAEIESAAVQLLLQQQVGQKDVNSSSTMQSQQLLQLVQQLQVAKSELWDAIHGPLYLHYSSAVSSSNTDSLSMVVTAVQPERLAWSWSQLNKAVNKLLAYQPGLLPDQSCARWSYLAQQLAAALQLEDQAPEPLLWRLGGHPQLPPSSALLAAQQQTAKLAAALAAAGGAGFKVDGRGQPAGLAAAGLDWQELLQQAVQAVQQQQQQLSAADGGDQAVLGPVRDALAAVTNGLEGSSAVQLRERLAAAAAAVLSCDKGFRRSVSQGLAMLGFVPHMQLLRQQQGGGSSSSHTNVAALAAVADSLQQQAFALLLPVLTQIITAPQPQQQEAAGAAAVVVAGKAANSSSWQLLPSRAMLSVSARALQLDLQQLVHTSAMQQEAALAESLLAWMVSTASTATGSLAPGSQQQLQQLLGALRWYLQTTGPASCQRSAADLVPYQQLSWLINSMLDNQQQLSHQQLMQQVLPGLLHDAWYSWQSGLWAGGSEEDSQYSSQGTSGGIGSSSSRGDGSALFGFFKGLSLPRKVTGSPLLLHLASRTAAVLQICAADAADGSSKAARLQQLSLAVQQLQKQSSGTAAGGRSSSSSEACSVLGLLLGQLLLAHVSSFPPAEARTLQQLVQQLTVWCSSSIGDSYPDASAAGQWLTQLRIVLSSSSHSTLLAVQHMLVTCAEATLSKGKPQQQQQQGASSSWYQQLSIQGWCWLLLGCARLQLVTPPAGVDPAGRYGYKARALNRWISDQLDPTIQVYAMMQQLPAGPDESAVLQELHNQRQGLCDELVKVRSRCVPRPDPPQYLHLQQEVAAFSQGLAEPTRVLSVGKALLDSSSSSGVAAGVASRAAAAVGEAEMWDGSAVAWAERIKSNFADYIDILQPVLLAVLEIRHGMALLCAGSKAARQAATTAQMLAAAPQQPGSDRELLSLTAGLLSFPPLLATTAATIRGRSSSQQLVATPASILAQPHWQKVTGVHIQQQQQQQQGDGQYASAASGQLAEFGWQLRAVHAALVVAVQEQLTTGSAAAAAAVGGSSPAATDPSSGGLTAVDSALQQLLSVWLSIGAYEAQAAEEAAQLFKHKTKTTMFMTQEVSGTAGARVA